MPLTLVYDENGQLKAVKEVTQADLDYQYNRMIEASRVAEEECRNRKVD